MRNMLPYNAVQAYDRILLGQLSADDFCGRNDYQGFRSSRNRDVVWGLMHV